MANAKMEDEIKKIGVFWRSNARDRALWKYFGRQMLQGKLRKTNKKKL